MFLQLQVLSLYLLQESGGVGWDPRSLWSQMGILAKLVVILMFIMSAYKWQIVSFKPSAPSILPELSNVA